jgi:XamI restriction endonuclease
MIPTDSLEHHEEHRLEARRLYENSLNSADEGANWRAALTESRATIIKALRESDYLFDVAGALEQSGSHMMVFRHLMAPPISQDQFKLICGRWSKSSEKSGIGVDKSRAKDIAKSFSNWRSRRLTPWLTHSRRPELREIYALIQATAPLIASQRVATAKRNRIARLQEQALIDLLLANGWIKIASRPIDSHGALLVRQFMHKARFASGKTGRAEVDIALGLNGNVVIALECKVTNDETNSVKRINDVLKKARAWRDHWGSFVKPAALLQGVIKKSDVKRLLDDDIHVFWSHRLDLFEVWLASEFARKI